MVPRAALIASLGLAASNDRGHGHGDRGVREPAPDSRATPVMTDPWLPYLIDVYGARVHERIAGTPEAVASRFDFLYWSSAPALAKTTGSLRVWHWWPGFRPSSRDGMQPGDGIVHMYRELGFFRWAPAEPQAALVSREGEAWAEVVRGGIGQNLSKEDDLGGVWYYARHGTGFWLHLGRVLDTTCDSRHRASSSEPRHLVPDTKEGRQRLLHEPIKLSCGVRRRRATAWAPANAASSSASSDSSPARPDRTETPREQEHHADEPGTSCQPEACHEGTRCTSDPHAGRYSPRCLDGLEDERPPMMRWMWGAAGLRASFDTVVRWTPELWHWWRRSSPKEVVDQRAYGTPRCFHPDASQPNRSVSPRCSAQPRFLPCGGWEPRRNASSLNIRTGWQASGPRCSECSNEEGVHLNCGPRTPPAAAQRKAVAAFANGSGLGPCRGMGMCRVLPPPRPHKNRSSVGVVPHYGQLHRESVQQWQQWQRSNKSHPGFALTNHSAPNPEAFFRHAQAHCQWAWLWWP